MVARLARIRHDNVAFTHGGLSQDVPPARARHAARHARTSGPAAPEHTALSIRSAERRRWSADLAGPDVTALVVHGMGGIGKSTLAKQIASRMRRLAPEQVITEVSGEVSAPSLGPAPAATGLVVLDSFDDNLSGPSGARTITDPALAALLSAWPGKLLITCATPFTLAPGEASKRFAFRHLGPLTRSGAAELALSLPALRLLGDTQRELAWRLTAGHPRAMEYLDALLATGSDLGDLAERVTAAVQASTGQGPAAAEPTELSRATAEAIAHAAGRLLFAELFGRLSSGAQDLLVRASVFRTPVAPGVLAARPAHVAECKAVGLLTPSATRELAVHRWTAAELHLRLAEAGQTAQLAAAHRQAAGYWHARTATPQLGPRAQVEAGYHLRRAGDLAADAADAAAGPGGSGSSRPARAPGAHAASAGRARRGPSRMRRLGLATVAGMMATLVVLEATNSLSTSHLTSAEQPDHRTAPAPITQAALARDQAAAWVAGQVSTGAILACDQVMCAVLVQHGFPAANLLVLGPAAPDPLGSGLVLATPAVRAMFGPRLVTVYAPQTVASFGTGDARIDVRVVAPDGAAAYRTALAADVRARQVAGQQLLADRRVTVGAPARAELAGGLVDARLLIILAAMAATEPVQILSFGGLEPGASPGTSLRAAEILAPAATARAMLAFVCAQRPPYLATRSGLSRGPDGQTALTIEFAAPSPLGLLPPQP